MYSAAPTPSCPGTASGDVYVTQPATFGSFSEGTGSLADPFQSLLVALHCLDHSTQITANVHLMLSDKNALTAAQNYYRLAEEYNTGTRNNDGTYNAAGTLWDRPLGYGKSGDP